MSDFDYYNNSDEEIEFEMNKTKDNSSNISTSSKQGQDTKDRIFEENCRIIFNENFNLLDDSHNDFLEARFYKVTEVKVFAGKLCIKDYMQPKKLIQILGLIKYTFDGVIYDISIQDDLIKVETNDSNAHDCYFLKENNFVIVNNTIINCLKDEDKVLSLSFLKDEPKILFSQHLTKFRENLTFIHDKTTYSFKRCDNFGKDVNIYSNDLLVCSFTNIREGQKKLITLDGLEICLEIKRFEVDGAFKMTSEIKPEKLDILLKNPSVQVLYDNKPNTDISIDNYIFLSCKNTFNTYDAMTQYTYNIHDMSAKYKDFTFLLIYHYEGEIEIKNTNLAYYIDKMNQTIANENAQMRLIIININRNSLLGINLLEKLDPFQRYVQSQFNNINKRIEYIYTYLKIEPPKDL